MRHFARIMIGALLLAASAGAGFAQDAVLTITDGRQTVEMSRETLAGLKQEVIETVAPKAAEKAKFSGPSFTDVLNAAGLSGETVRAEGLDGYAKDIPRERLTADGAIVAISVNDADLPAEHAPFRIIFPYEKSPEMNDRTHHSWSVYQLKSLTIK